MKEREGNEMPRDTEKIFEVIAPVIKNLKRGTEENIECPDCGGKMKISSSPYNGHIWVVCENCGVKLSQ